MFNNVLTFIIRAPKIHWHQRAQDSVMVQHVQHACRGLLVGWRENPEVGVRSINYFSKDNRNTSFQIRRGNIETIQNLLSFFENKKVCKFYSSSKALCCYSYLIYLYLAEKVETFSNCEWRCREITCIHTFDRKIMPAWQGKK